MKKLILSTALILASVASASAATITPGLDDLILSFAQTGNANNFEVDLGAASLFDQGAPLTSGSTYFFTTTAGALNTDLTSIYGSNWATVGNVTWSVSGVADSSSDFFTTAQSSTNLKYTGGISTISGNVRAIASTLNNGTSGSTAFGSDDVGVEIGTTSTGAFSHQVGLNGGTYGGIKNGSNAAKLTDIASGSSTSMDLFYFDTGTSGADESDLGTFTLTSAGTFSFGTAPSEVPEPSTYALMLGGIALLLVLRRKSVRA